ncbi:conserved unknown protein [Ectocarpus siliculosus]|uniref:Methyltransferase type 11 domain-containing protein n=1 Tax=Ectocarpus siliculosus TaxID=2880 RepID=D7FI59_ECTSI|nr:conserved unknown protein [Ectocarpus siliculosus]|eukprot:CBJ28685.1 conserved unknown protein [Ectocarpus siliculosus]
MRLSETAATAALCLAGAGNVAGFQSPWVGGRAAGGAEQRQRGVTTATEAPQSRPGRAVSSVSMVANMNKTKGKGNKGDELPNVKVSAKDRRMGSKTEADKMDSESFPILEDLEEAEDTNIKVTPNAWKWPALWPYTPDYFDRPDESEDEKTFATARMQPCLEGAPKEALVEHYARFLTEGAEVLEIGASVASYLPEDLSFSKVVGVGMNDEEMKSNPRLTDTLVQNLNSKPELPYPADSFDFVLVPNSMEFFTDPRLVMREVYRVLKPKGLCMIPFTSQGAYKEYEKKQIKMWKTMNDAQHMWIIGSFFKFSADAGWDDLKGYDMSTGESNMLTKFVGNTNELFVVQAKTQEEKQAALALVDPLVSVYDVLAELPVGVLFAPYKAILAEALASSCWMGSEEQIATLREGLGLTPAGDEFWGPLGEATKFLHPEDRVRLLVDFVRAFSGEEEMRQALLEVKDVLGPVSETLKEKRPLWSKPDNELMTTELIVTDFIGDTKEGREGFLEWLRGVDSLQLEVWADERKNFKVKAKEEMESGGRRTAAI